VKRQRPAGLVVNLAGRLQEVRGAFYGRFNVSANEYRKKMGMLRANFLLALAAELRELIDAKDWEGLPRLMEELEELSAQDEDWATGGQAEQ
jgi:hypothetical protein